MPPLPQPSSRLASEIQSSGSLEGAIARLHVDECSELLSEAQAYKSAQRQATESIDQRCFRLGLMAADKDAEGERHMAAAADAAGRAAGRRLKGFDDAMAASLDREVSSCTSLALEASAEAERLRSQAASLRRAQAYAADVIALAAE